MTRQYSPKTFFRQAPNSCLKHYFLKQKLLKDFDFDHLKKSQVDQIYEAFDNLEFEQRRRIENDFRDIFTLASPKGLNALFCEAQENGVDLATQFGEEDSNDYEKAFWAFFNASEIFERALLFAQIEELPPSYSRKRADLPKKSIRNVGKKNAKLAESISYFFRTTQGRGYKCQIDHFKHNDLDYFFAFPEDYARTTMEWQKSGLERRVQKPAFEVIFAYSSKTGALEIWFGGSIKVVRELQSIFARTVLKSELPPEKKDEPLYDLSSLRSGRFEFPFEAGSGIESVRIKKLGLSIMGEHSRKITLEADSSENANAVYDLMAQVIQMEDAPDCSKCNRIPIALVNISHVSLEVKFVPNGKRGRHSKSFSLAYPSSCTLKDDERDMLLREMLIKWGFEKPHSTPKER